MLRCPCGLSVNLVMRLKGLFSIPVSLFLRQSCENATEGH